MGRSCTQAMPRAALDPDGAARLADRCSGPPGRIPRSRASRRRAFPPGFSASLRAHPPRRDRPAHRPLRFRHRRECLTMKIASFKTGSVASYGIVTDAGVIDAGRRLKDFPTLKALLAKGSLDALKALRNERVDYALTHVELLPTVPDPDKIFCI